MSHTETAMRVAECIAAHGESGQVLRAEDTAASMLGDEAVRVVDRVALPGMALMARIRGKWRIYLRAGLSPDEQSYAIFHELAEYVLVTRLIATELNFETVANSAADVLQGWGRGSAATTPAASGVHWARPRPISIVA